MSDTSIVRRFTEGTQTRSVPIAVRESGAPMGVASIGVPYDDEIELFPRYYESVAPGAVLPRDARPLLWLHRDPIGVVTDASDTDRAWEYAAKISDTTLGRDAHTLVTDGAVRSSSIGFRPVRWTVTDDETGTHIRHEEIDVLEVSLVPVPAYEGATITDVRHQPTNTTAARHTNQEETTMPDETATELRDAIAALTQSVATMRADITHRAAPPTDNRSAGEVLRAIVAGDQATIDAYQAMQRAYTGGTTADLGTALKPAWVGDLTRIFDASSGVLADVFSTGSLPDTGMSIEFAELGSNTIDVAEVAEGADMGTGKVVITTRNAPVKTYAGSASLTRQEIERATNVNMLTTTLEAMATAAGARKKAVLRAAFDALVTARTAIAANGGVVVLGATLAAATATNWENALIDAAIRFDAQNLNPETLVVSATVFKQLRGLTVAGERVFQTWKDNASGELNLPGLSGQLAGLPVRLDAGQTGDSAVFANARAIRQYDSQIVNLSDENIINLSKTYAVYRYGAVAPEIPAGIIPVKLAAS